MCAKRNIHDRTLADLTKICSNWVKTPDHMINLDVRTLLQDDAIQEVEMEDAVEESPTTTTTISSNDNNDDDKIEGQDQRGSGKLGNNEGEEEDDDNDDEGFRKVIRSKWDGDVSETNLGKQHLIIVPCFSLVACSSLITYVCVLTPSCQSLSFPSIRGSFYGRPNASDHMSVKR